MSAIEYILKKEMEKTLLQSELGYWLLSYLEDAQIELQRYKIYEADCKKIPEEELNLILKYGKEVTQLRTAIEEEVAVKLKLRVQIYTLEEKLNDAQEVIVRAMSFPYIRVWAQQWIEKYKES